MIVNQLQDQQELLAGKDNRGLNMKKLVYLFWMLILVASVSAYPVRIIVESDSDFHTNVWKCWGDDCYYLTEELGNYYGSSNEYVLDGSGQQYFGEYNYKDCYMPQTYIVSTDDQTGEGPWSYNVDFEKATDCAAPVREITMEPQNPEIGDTVTITAKVEASHDFPAETGPQSVPSDLVYPHFASTVDVHFYADDELQESGMAQIPFGVKKEFTYTYTITEPGEHNFSVHTWLPNECQCESTIWQDKYLHFEITEPVCGNGIIEEGEECDPPNHALSTCDHGNSYLGDYCDSNCQLQDEHCEDDYPGCSSHPDCDELIPGTGGCDQECQPLAYCGDGFVDPDEECELPETEDNTYCDQSTKKCVGLKTATRDEFGYCDSSCGCVDDNWNTALCVEDSCEAQCDSDGDCPENSCEETYEDYCNGNKLVEYDSDKVLDSTVVRESCDNSCFSDCTCENCSVDCFAEPQNEYCVQNVCGAQCDSDDDCFATECDHLDGCIGKDYYDYSDKVNDCMGNCMCEDNSCSNPTIYEDDPRCTECQDDSDCNYLDNDYCVGDLVKHDQGVCVDYACQVQTTTEDCNQYDQEYCSGTQVWEDDGICDNAECSVATSLVEQCDDGLACNGQETCEEDLDTAFCVPGEPIDCSDNDKEEISTCNNIPDDNPYTWDYRESFESECIEPGECTTWGGIITHACDISRCNAECEKNSDCDDSNPLTDDICVECECEHIKQGYCGDGIVDPDAGEECELPNTVLASCDYGEDYLQDYCDANCKLQDNHCEDDYPGCTADSQCDELIPGTAGCDLTCQPYECMDDSDCDYLDDDYCEGDLVKHDQGVCIENKCETETTTNDCNELDSGYCVGTEHWGRDGTCSNAECVVSDTLKQDCDDGLACNGQESCEEDLATAFCLPGEPIDCSDNDKEEISTCNNIPDDNPYTWDYRESFESECIEPGECTTWGGIITHACDISRCNAECEKNSDCDDSNPLTDDICVECECEHIKQGYCGDGIVDPDAGEECELPNTVLASCDYGEDYLQDYCDSNCKLQDDHCEDDYPGCTAHPDCDEVIPGTAGCDLTCQPYECMDDSDCDYLDDDYCEGDLVKHDHGVCIENKCETETTTEDCNELDTEYCSGTSIITEDHTCSNAECVIAGSGSYNCDDGLACNGQETCEETPGADHQAECVSGEPIDCSEYDIEEILTCNNIPDGNPYTWDKREGFESECVEPGECTTEDDTLTHTCDISRCNAECETDSDCDNSDPLTDDICTDSCICEYTHNGYCGDGIVDPDAGEECELPNTVLASCDEHGSPYLQDYCDANCKLQDNHCEDDYAGCLSAPECDEFAPGTNGCDEMCQPYECMEDSDCDYLDDDYCDGDFVKHDNGVCIENQCEVETTAEDCSQYDEESCQGTEIWVSEGTCSDAQCIVNDYMQEECDDGLGCNGQESCEEDNDSAFCVSGEPIDCSEYDIEGISTCNNIPDDNPYTFDYRESFESECVEPGECTTEDETIEHTCDISECDAECETNSDCDDSDPLTDEVCKDCVCEYTHIGYCGDGIVDTASGEECELPGTSDNKNCFAREEECVGNKLSVAQGYGDCSYQCKCTFGEFESELQCVAGRCGAECATDADCFDDNPTTIDICSDCMCEYEKTECDYNYIKDPKAKIKIDRIGFVHDEIVRPGEELQIVVNFKNMGYCEMKSLEIEAFVQGLGIKSRRLGPMSVNADGELTRDLLLEIPDDARPGFYMVKLELYNEGLRRVRHRPIIVI